jgi:hypothetical protein
MLRPHQFSFSSLESLAPLFPECKFKKKKLPTHPKVFDRVKSVALWSANIRKLAKDHKGYGSAATTSPVLVSFGPWKDQSKRKTCVRFVYILPQVLHGFLLSEIKYLVNLE